jgi:predicted TIM-barrel fold metal-dependent hydrolase
VTIAADGDDFQVLDIHQHIPAEPGEFERDRSARLAFMDRFGIDQACVSPPVLAPRTVSSAELNRRVSAYASARPDRFPVAFGTIDVRGGDAELALLENFSELRLRGVVWHHMFQGAFLDHAAMDPALEFCAGHRLVALIHVIVGSLAESPWRLARLCERHPTATFVALDGLSSPHQADWTIELAAHLPNLFADTGVLSSFGNAVEKFAERVGSDRLLLGTDFDTLPKSFSFPYPLYEVAYSSLDGPAKQNILAGNARRILAA